MLDFVSEQKPGKRRENEKDRKGTNKSGRASRFLKRLSSRSLDRAACFMSPSRRSFGINRVKRNVKGQNFCAAPRRAEPATRPKMNLIHG